MKKRINHTASFKDPAARVFYLEGDEGYFYRELSPSYLSHYHQFKSSGLAALLIEKNWLLPFEELIGNNEPLVLKTRRINFISYPYEWTFNQWKDAALLTLKIQHQALKHGMILKDATPFNIVFDGSKPLFVDISSFEIYTEGRPWQAFKQFCENFYIPLLLLKYFDATGNEIYLNNINGITVNKGLSLLPSKAYFNFNNIFFLAMPGRIRAQLKSKPHQYFSKSITIKNLVQFTEQLFNSIHKLRQTKMQTKWNDYYDKNIDAAYLQEKDAVIKKWIDTNYENKILIDFGCNTGHFSKLAAPFVQTVIAFDADMRSAGELYIHCKEQKINNIFSFAASLVNPTPAMGWNNEERLSLKERMRGDIGLALALVHHLAVGNHIQFDMMADFFAATCNELIIEFVPLNDDKVQLIMNGREAIFEWYNRDNFIWSFSRKFSLIKEHTFSNKRQLFHFASKKDE